MDAVFDMGGNGGRGVRLSYVIGGFGRRWERKVGLRGAAWGCFVSRFVVVFVHVKSLYVRRRGKAWED